MQLGLAVPGEHRDAEGAELDPQRLPLQPPGAHGERGLGAAGAARLRVEHVDDQRGEAALPHQADRLQRAVVEHRRQQRTRRRAVAASPRGTLSMPYSMAPASRSIGIRPHRHQRLGDPVELARPGRRGEPAQRATEGDQPDPVVGAQVGLGQPGCGPHRSGRGWRCPARRRRPPCPAPARGRRPAPRRTGARTARRAARTPASRRRAAGRRGRRGGPRRTRRPTRRPGWCARPAAPPARAARPPGRGPRHPGRRPGHPPRRRPGRRSRRRPREPAAAPGPPGAVPSGRGPASSG